LQRLQWLTLPQARGMDLPFVTRVILAEIEAIVQAAPAAGVPFFDNATDCPAFERL
jgi:hypothetical protein